MQKMIYLFNPHKEYWFGITIKAWIYRKPWKPKYGHMIDQLIKNQGVVRVLCKPNESNLIAKKYLYMLKEYLGVKLWAIVNRKNPLKFRCIFDSKLIKLDDFLIVVYIGNFSSFEGPIDSEKTVNFLNLIEGKIILNVNHYPYNIEAGVRALSKLKFHYFWAESDFMKNSEFFNKYFCDFKKKFVVTPFVVRDNFFKKTNFSARFHKAVAVGTVSLDMSNDVTFYKFFGHGVLQPLRKKIYEESKKFPIKAIDSYVSDINEGGELRAVRGAPSFFASVQNWFHNVFRAGQRKYHSLGMCELFNSYKIHVVGEEIVGLPGIGFAEGMACGSVFVGLDDEMYTDLGMIPNVHYISYKGGYINLQKVIDEALADGKNLSSISENGCKFANENFRADAVFQKFLSQLN